MTYGYRADGLLYWHVNYWHGNKTVTGDSTYLKWKPLCVASMCGDGGLLYPTPDGPVSSIRLENVRDGIEDYDYFQLLAKRCGRPRALRVYRGMVMDLTTYSRDPACLRRLRDGMAAAILGRDSQR